VFKPVVRCTEEVAVWTVCEIEAVSQVNCLSSRRARHAACCSSLGNQLVSFTGGGRINTWGGGAYGGPPCQICRVACWLLMELTTTPSWNCHQEFSFSRQLAISTFLWYVISNLWFQLWKYLSSILVLTPFFLKKVWSLVLILHCGFWSVWLQMVGSCRGAVGNITDCDAYMAWFDLWHPQ
jgi:hypothetical protein